MGTYPRPGKKSCAYCGKTIILRHKQDARKSYCDTKCVNEHRRAKEAARIEASKIPCQHCGKPFKSYEYARFCSTNCVNLSRRIYHDRVCQTCGKHFQVRSAYEIRRGDHKYCSHECFKRKYHFVEVDFTVQTHENMYWLGFMFATLTGVEETHIELDADESSLTRLVAFLKGNMTPAKVQDAYRLTLFSRPFSRKMRLVGLRDDLYMEAPAILPEYRMDFVRGFMDSPRGYIYRDGGDLVAALHGQDSKLMRWMADATGGQLAYKDKEWVVVCRNLPASCDGLPRNEEKWARMAAARQAADAPTASG